jgi:hypothetical protein
MKKLTVVLLGVGLALCGWAAVYYAVQRAGDTRIGPAHIYELSEAPSFLTEELALTKAREVLNKAGIDLKVWHAQRDGRTSAPDGRVDEFAARNGNNFNRVVFAFTNGSGATRFVSVELNGKRVVCQASLGK